MCSIMEQTEHPELFALEFGKIAETDFVYTLASPNISQSAPNQNCLELFALEIAESDFVYTLASTNVDQ